MLVVTLTASMMGARASLPPGWSGSSTDGDIGSLGTPGNASFTGTSSGGVYTGTFTVSGGPGSISGGNTVDAFHYAWESVTGNFIFTARLTGQTGTNTGNIAKAGIMVRDGTSASARFVLNDTNFSPISGAGYVRESLNGNSVSAYQGYANTYPLWLKIVRYGDLTTLYYSNDDGNGNPASWTIQTEGGEEMESFNPTLLIGLVAENQGSGVKGLNTATFDNVSLAPYSSFSSSNGQPYVTSWAGNTWPGGSVGATIYAIPTLISALASDASGNLYSMGGPTEILQSEIFDTSGNLTGGMGASSTLR